MKTRRAMRFLVGALVATTTADLTAAGSLSNPIALTRLHSGQMVALEGGRLVWLSRLGHFQRETAISPEYEPIDMVSAKAGEHDTVYVTLRSKKLISGSSAHLGVFYDSHREYRPLAGPSAWYGGLARDASNRTLYLCDLNSGQIFRIGLLDPTLKPTYILTIQGKFVGPIAVNSTGDRLFAVDLALGVVYSADLIHGQVKSLPGSVGQATAIAFDTATSRLFVADGAGNRIWLYNLNSTHSMPEIFVEGNGLNQPTGLALGNSGSIWVVNKGSGKVLLFDRVGRPIPPS